MARGPYKTPDKNAIASTKRYHFRQSKGAIILCHNMGCATAALMMSSAAMTY